jgi:O-Antigen ligase
VISALSAPPLSTAWYVGAHRRRVTTLAVLTVVTSLISVALVLQLHIVSAVVLFTWIVLAAIAWRPRVGLYVTWGLVLLFEAGGPDSLMLPGAYFHGGLSSTTGLPGVITSPLELLLLLTFGIWLIQGVVRHSIDFRPGRLFWPMLLFFLALVFGLIRGQLGGGNLNIALWESRCLFYIVICYLLAANTIRSRRHVATLMTIGLIAMGLFAIEATYRRIALIDTGVLGIIMEFAYSHEVVIFLGVLIFLVLAQHIFGGPLWQRMLGLFVLLPFAIYALLATERRSGYIAVMVAFLALTLVLLVVKRKAFFLLAVPVIVGGAIYLPVFWNTPGLIGQPARAVRSLYEPDPRDEASNMYRELEKINVRATIHSDPLLGVGFGREFLFAVGMPDLSFWPFWHYMPHHNILWVWLKVGAVGFIIFWVLMGSALMHGAHLIKVLRTPETRVFATMALTGIVCTLIFCWVDLGLTMSRVTTFLGICIGTLAVLDQLHDERTPRKETSRDTRIGRDLHTEPSGPHRKRREQRVGERLSELRSAGG